MLYAVVAMQNEADTLRSAAKILKERTLYGKRVLEGNAFGHDFGMVLCGVGKTNAAAGTMLALTLGAGFKGGEIVPTFFVGATFGCVAAPFLGLAPSFSAAVGTVAAFCGVTNCPISSILLACELFGGGGLPLYALAIAVAYRLSGYSGLYSEQQIVYSKRLPHIHAPGQPEE